MITVILPCAGEGKRLGLPFPKELAPLGPGRVVIDSCLDLIAEIRVPFRIVLREDGKREATARHIRDRLPKAPLAMVRDTGEADLPDAIVKMAPWLGLTNVLMLPDVIYDAEPGLVTRLASMTGPKMFAVAAAAMAPDRLGSLGALAVSGDRITAYEDKPADPSPYNAAWGMLGFSNVSGMRIIARVTAKNGKASTPVLGAPVIWLNDFRDCGTWEGYCREFARNSPSIQ